MKSKRFTTLIAIFVISLLACAAMFGITVASAEQTDLGNYFTVTDATAKIENDKIVFDVQKSGATITSKYDFYLPETTVSYTATEGVTVKVNTENAEDADKLVITVTYEGEKSGVAVTVSNIETAGQSLYTISNGVLTANVAAAYVTDFTFDNGKAIVWGYNYSATFNAYHGFMEKINKEFVIVYGADKADCDAQYANYTDDDQQTTYEGLTSYNVTSAKATVKFVTYNADAEGVAAVNPASDKNFVMAYWAITNEGAPANKSLALVVRNDVPNVAPVYNNLDEFYTEAVTTPVSPYDNYVKKVDAATKTDGEWKYIGSSTYFNVPTEIYDYIVSEYFDSEDLTYVIYYKLPETDSFTKLSSTSSVKRFALSKLGFYEYYVVATDPLNNAFEVDEEWELKIVENYKGLGEDVKGFFDETDELKVPVFTFYMGNKGPQVTAGSSYQDAGYVGSVYTGVSSFTTKGNDVTTEYTLWYNSTASATSFSMEEGSGWYEIGTKEGFDAVKGTFNWDDEDFTTLAWSISSLNFTPIARGSYVVRCVASDGEAESDEAVTQVINVNTEMKRVSINTTSIWFQNNWKSVLFLGIALLSLVGIIVLFFVKPKEETDIDAE